MLWEQNIKSTTREIKLAFAREHNLHLLAIDPFEKSIHHIDNNIILSYMDLGDRKKIAETMLQNVHLSLHLLKNLQKLVKEHNDHVMKGNFAADIGCANFTNNKTHLFYRYDDRSKCGI